MKDSRTSGAIVPAMLSAQHKVFGSTCRAATHKPTVTVEQLSQAEHDEWYETDPQGYIAALPDNQRLLLWRVCERCAAEGCLCEISPRLRAVYERHPEVFQIHAGVNAAGSQV